MSLAPPSNHRWGCAQWGCAAVGGMVLVAVLLPIFPIAPAPPYTASCLSNIKQLSTGLRMYSQDYEDHLPPAAAWHDLSLPYVKNERVYVCPKRTKLATGYAFNRLLDGASVNESLAPDKTPMLFESGRGQRNGADAVQSFVTPHNKGGSVGFVDGHVRRSLVAPLANVGLRNDRR